MELAEAVEGWGSQQQAHTYTFNNMSSNRSNEHQLQELCSKLDRLTAALDRPTQPSNTFMTSRTAEGAGRSEPPQGSSYGSLWRGRDRRGRGRRGYGPPMRASSAGNAQSTPITCNYCGGVNHYERYCLAKRNSYSNHLNQHSSSM